MRSSNHQRGFSLIEVLIAILVLALGLLGLGAVFPVVISQQRAAVDATQGEVVASTAEALLTGQGEVIDLKYLHGDIRFGEILPPVPVWDPIEYAYLWSGGFINGPFGFSMAGFPEYDLETGDIAFPNVPDRVDSENTPTMDDPWVRTLPLVARLYPQPYSGVDPAFVWDFVARREPTRNAVQIGIFVRRIDSRLPVQRDMSLSDVLTGNVAQQRLFPVASNNTGLPTVDRRRDPSPPVDIYYSIPRFLDIYVLQDQLDRFYFQDLSGMTDTSREFARKVGQKLLDNTGVVRTVMGVDKDDVNVVIVDPPFRFEGARRTPGDFDETNESQRASRVQQIVFTPLTPAAVRVFTVGEGS